MGSRTYLPPVITLVAKARHHAALSAVGLAKEPSLKLLQVREGVGE